VEDHLGRDASRGAMPHSGRQGFQVGRTRLRSVARRLHNHWRELLTMRTRQRARRSWSWGRGHDWTAAFLVVLPVWALVNSLVCEAACAGSHGHEVSGGHAHDASQHGHGDAPSDPARARADMNPSGDLTAICAGCTESPLALSSIERTTIDQPMMVHSVSCALDRTNRARIDRLRVRTMAFSGWPRNPPLLL